MTREVGLKCYYSYVKLFKALDNDWVKLVTIYQNLSTLNVPMASVLSVTAFSVTVTSATVFSVTHFMKFPRKVGTHEVDELLFVDREVRRIFRHLVDGNDESALAAAVTVVTVDVTVITNDVTGCVTGLDSGEELVEAEVKARIGDHVDVDDERVVGLASALGRVAHQALRILQARLHRLMLRRLKQRQMFRHPTKTLGLVTSEASNRGHWGLKYLQPISFKLIFT